MGKLQLRELEQEEIARLIKAGFTSGKITDKEGMSVSWTLIYEKWADGEE